LKAIALALTDITTKNDPLCSLQDPVTVFHCLRVPPISIAEYLLRIGVYSNCSPESYIIAMVYIDRLLTLNCEINLTSLNVHRLVITAVLLAIKGRDDTYYSNAYYASIGGVSTAQINRLELTFLEMMRFELFVSNAAYFSYRDRLLWYLNHHDRPGSSMDPKICVDPPLAKSTGRVIDCPVIMVPSPVVASAPFYSSPVTVS